MRRPFTYGVVGGLLSSWIPIGLLALAAARRHSGSLFHRHAAHEIVIDPGEAAYLAGSITIAFVCVGYVLGRQADRLEAFSETDSLTRLYNARGLWKRLQAEVARAKRFREPLALLFLDLDGLKSINDTYGHVRGDVALRKVADAIRAELRTVDIGGRWGGDEFAIIAPNTSERSALALGERVRVLAAQLTSTWRGTTSLGVATIDSADRRESFDAGALIQAADIALYEAKQQGGNRVVSRSPLSVDCVPRTGPYQCARSTVRGHPAGGGGMARGTIGACRSDVRKSAPQVLSPVRAYRLQRLLKVLRPAVLRHIGLASRARRDGTSPGNCPARFNRPQRLFLPGTSSTPCRRSSRHRRQDPLRRRQPCG